MRIEKFLEITSSLVIVFSALFCSILIIMRLNFKKSRVLNSPLFLVLFFYLVLMIYYLTGSFYYLDIKIYENFGGLNQFAFLLITVLFYHNIFCLAQIQNEDNFTYAHYVTPVVVFIVYSIVDFLIPNHIVTVAKNSTLIYINRGLVKFSNSKYLLIAIRSVFIVMYCIFIIKKVLIYRNNDKQEKSFISRLGRIYELLSCVLIIFLLAFFCLFLASDSIEKYIATILFNCSIFLFNVFLCNNALSVDLPLLSKDIVFDISQKVKVEEHKINKEYFERYISEQKPYLISDLKITDMVIPLGTNRSYLSNFINRNYQMNFNCFINKCRLEEFERMEKSKEYTTFSKKELIYLVGFNNIRSYYHTREKLKKYTVPDIKKAEKNFN